MRMTDERTPYFPEQTEHQDILTTMGLLDFVWDAAKNEHNIAIHHVSFETAMLVFNDVNRIEVYDDAYSEDEDRYDTIGRAIENDPVFPSNHSEMKLTLGRVHGLLFVVYTDRIILGRERIRLISARLANKLEERLYLNQDLS